MSGQGFIPDIWQEAVISEIRDHRAVLTELAGKPRKKPIWRNRSRMWLLIRRVYGAFWRAVTEHGKRRGFLEHDYCYECAGEVVPTVATRHVVKWLPADDTP